MGEIYRADDLELNQSVALKFLPERIGRNPADLARLRREVRIARQIAHPNVCRTYDIAEADGQIFIVMEYVDGEDLASMLRRLGRPSPDKALEIARQLCLGLGAAHENGVLHRDLKPANIMIDGQGRVRITDFGLAGTAEEIEADRGAGTPGYMAPEQETSGAATVQSDIYGLGLVLFELFTGRRASEMAVRPDPMRPGTETGIRTPSSLVAGIDPAVERAILRCLDRDPARRIQSAYAVFGALPGGDPLAAAVAAGETPSPELVANAGDEGTMRPLHAALAILVVVAAIVALSFVQRPLYSGFGLPVSVLTARAEEIRAMAAGQPRPRFSFRGYRYTPDEPRPVKQFWMRWSPAPIVPSEIHTSWPSIDDPPQVYPGSATIVMNPEGRLLGLTAIPPDSLGDSSSAGHVEWGALLRATGRDPAFTAPTSPPRNDAVRADTIAAWTIAGDTRPDTTIVAASFRGRIVDMKTRVGGRLLAEVRVSAPESRIPLTDLVIFVFLFVIPFFGAIFLALRNLKARRGDVRGAIVIGLTVGLLYVPKYILSANIHELGLMELLSELLYGSPAGHILIHGVGVAVAYLAIEPYVRRLWPNVLVGWARLVAGRWRDPIVGRDLLIGAAGGALVAGLMQCLEYASRAIGVATEPPRIDAVSLPLVVDAKEVVGAVPIMLSTSIGRGVTFFTLLVILRYVLRNSRAAVVSLTLISFLLLWSGLAGPKPTLLSAPFILVFALALTFAALRYGALAVVVMMLFDQILTGLPWTSDLSVWFTPQILTSWGIVAILLAYGFFIAVGGKSILRDPLGEPLP
jgi:serine/threonine-protein kinase